MDSPTTQTGHIFISYEHDDQAYTRKLRDSLRQRGFEVWMDEHLESGDRWLRTIEQAVRDSAAVVVVMTPEARDSEWVEAEILLAQDEGKPIFPLLLRGRVFFSLVTKQYTDVTNGRMPPDDFYKRLEVVQARSKDEVTEDPLASPGPAVRKKRIWSWQRLRWPWAVVGLLALVFGAVVIGGLVSGLYGGVEGRTVMHEKSRAQMVDVPGGTFEMGSTEGDHHERPVHTVTLDSFYIDKYEVTNVQYSACVYDGVCTPPSNFSSNSRDSYFTNPEYADYPVIYVSWEQAMTYCSWRGARLPTEAEWEKAARGTDGQIYPWGDQAPNSSLANFNQNERDTTPVGSYPDGVSPYGVYDMAGNVWEWVADWYNSDYYASALSQNPQGPSSGDDKVLRGGSWHSVEGRLPATYRIHFPPSTKDLFYGFRCAASPDN